jgi:short-subunit dehydrogenase
LSEGHIVYGAARRVEQMKFLEENGGHALKMDIKNDEDIKAAIDKIIKDQGKIDVLINNAGYAIYGAVEDTEIEDARAQFEVNLFGLGRITQLVLPHMRKQGKGLIINMSSMGGKMYTPLGSWYHASKHALEGWSDCLRLELKQHNIDVVIVEPGIIRTEFVDVMYQPMVDRSKGGAYESFANTIANASKDTYSEKKSSSPDVIAEQISKAVNASKPKTRYVAGKMAKPLMLIRKFFGDKLFDKAVMSQVK